MLIDRLFKYDALSCIFIWIYLSEVKEVEWSYMNLNS